jgi:hypothetical protein
MTTHGMKIRRELRSARASALTDEQRRQELRETGERGTHDAHYGRDEPAESAAPPRAAGQDRGPRPPEAEAGEAGADQAH